MLVNNKLSKNIIEIYVECDRVASLTVKRCISVIFFLNPNICTRKRRNNEKSELDELIAKKKKKYIKNHNRNIIKSIIKNAEVLNNLDWGK